MVGRPIYLDPLLLAVMLCIIIAGSGLILLNITFGTMSYAASVYIIVFESALSFTLMARMAERKRRGSALVTLTEIKVKKQSLWSLIESSEYMFY